MEQYYEHQTSCGIIRGVIHRPDHRESSPIVCLLHGFTGNKMDSHFMFVRLARELCKQGVGVLRFDFIGSGDSDGEFKDMTFLKEFSQAKEMMEEIKTFDWVEKIYVTGFSMGGALAALVAANYPEEVKKLVLLAPAGYMGSLATRYLDLPEEKILANGNIDLGGLELGRAFIDEIVDLDLFEGVQLYQGPVKIIHGTEDQAVSLDTSKHYMDTYTQPVEYVEIKGADHCFSSIRWTNQMVSEVLEFLIK
ncbi:MAG: alpha/beta hydrolase family protein [Turicibacter sp.]